MSDRRFFMLTGTVVAVAIAVSLYFINNIYTETHNANAVKQAQEFEAEDYVDAYRHSIEYNGMPVNRDLMLSGYNRKGKLLRENVSLGELIQGKGCIALLSQNNCPGCVRNEIAMLRSLDKEGRILFIYDSPGHEHSVTGDIPAPVYYEFGEGELLPGLEKGQEVPVLLYVEDGKVTASCVVSNHTSPLTSEFHKFLKKRLNDE